jgi:hypothetical protein
MLRGTKELGRARSLSKQRIFAKTNKPNVLHNPFHFCAYHHWLRGVGSSLEISGTCSFQARPNESIGRIQITQMVA